MQFVTISANNLMLWQKAKEEISPKYAERWVYEQLLGKFTLLLYQFYQSVFHNETVAHLDLNHSLVHYLLPSKDID